MALKKIRLFVALALPFFAGCAQLQGVPSTEPFEPATLKKAKSAQHWDVIARDVAAETALLKDKAAALQGKPLHVALSSDGSSFSRAFHTLLVSRLVNHGLDVSTQPAGAATVHYETQVVRHLDNRGGYYNTPGPVAALTGGVLVAREIDIGNMSHSGKAVAGVALIAASELSAAYGRLYSPTNTGVVEMKMRSNVFIKEDTGELLLSRDVRELSKTHNAQVVVVGNYAVASAFVYVTLKVVNVADNRVISADNYALPLTRNIKTLLAI